MGFKSMFVYYIVITIIYAILFIFSIIKDFKCSAIIWGIGLICWITKIIIDIVYMKRGDE